MIPAVVAGVAAAVLGPFTLMLAHRCMQTSWRPGRTETAAVVTAAGLAVLCGTEGRGFGFPLSLPLAVIGPAAAAVDAREGRLPDVLTVPLLGATLLLTAATRSDGAWLVAVAAGVTAGAVIVALTAHNALGWGDVKLVPTVALVLGGHEALVGGLLRIIALVGVTALLVWLYDRRALVPYGPALIIGTIGTSGG